MSSPPAKRDYIAADDFSSPAAMATLSQTVGYRHKARQLHGVIQATLGDDTKMSYKDVEDVVRFIKASKLKVKANLKGRRSLYIHPGDGRLIKIPVQIYDNGHIYLHLKRFDTAIKKGGYKTFSRSVEYKSAKAYANLVSEIHTAKDARVVLGELSKMALVHKSKSIISFRDADAYTSHDKVHGLEHKIVFQAELYDGDMALFQSVLARSPRLLIEASFQAAMALNDLHAYGYMHRDIKPGNFFIRNIDRRMELVIADLGLTQHHSEESFGRSLAGTRGYMDPVLCYARTANRWPLANWEGGVKADIFSLGVALHSILYPEHTDSLFRAVNTINHLAMPKDKSRATQPTAIYRAMDYWQREYQTSRGTLAGEAMHEPLRKYEHLVLEMMHPEPAKRPSLPVIIARFDRLRGS